jgi:hypothetical protein
MPKDSGFVVDRFEPEGEAILIAVVEANAHRPAVAAVLSDIPDWRARTDPSWLFDPRDSYLRLLSWLGVHVYEGEQTSRPYRRKLGVVDPLDVNRLVPQIRDLIAAGRLATRFSTASALATPGLTPSFAYDDVWWDLDDAMWELGDRRSTAIVGQDPIGEIVDDAEAETLLRRLFSGPPRDFPAAHSMDSGGFAET